jgi:hypothetical protein
MTDKKDIEKFFPSIDEIKDYRADEDIDLSKIDRHPNHKNVETPIIHAEVVEDDEQLESELSQDFVVARAKIRQAAETAYDVVVELKEIAEQSGHPRAYEVLNQSIKNLASVSRDLVELYKIKNESKTAKEEEGEKTVTNNNLVFTGSTTELAKIIKELNAQKK